MNNQLFFRLNCIIQSVVTSLSQFKSHNKQITYRRKIQQRDARRVIESACVIKEPIVVRKYHDTTNKNSYRFYIYFE